MSVAATTGTTTGPALPALRWVVRVGDDQLAARVDALRARLAPLTAASNGQLPEVAVVVADAPLGEAGESELLALAGAGTPVLLAGPTLEQLPADSLLVDAAGVVVGRGTPVHEVRVRAGQAADVAARLGDHVLVRDRVLRLDKTADDVEVLLTANVARTDHAVATFRPGTGVGTLTLDPTAAAQDREVLRLLVLTLRHLAAVPVAAPVRVGLLAYGAIGHEHNRAVQATDGLELSMVCDRSPGRLAVARSLAPEARTTTDAEELVADPETDLVVVSTPPDTHAAWALRAIEHGKHVVVEKPFALRTEEADAVLAAAAERGLLACVYQNRRFDPDHLALRRLVRAGALGEVFHAEAFVGGYGHPCNYWHSDEDVSGGAIYDWGAHVLDQLLDLVPLDVEHVTAAEHKRVWHDVTNADHSRVTVRFAGGVEAEFVHSDLAAALKPRWYVLGTEGAVVGQWRTEKVVRRSDIGTLDEDVLAPADSPPLLELHAPDGSVTAVATPSDVPYGFHREVADLLLVGLPMTVTGAQSRRVLAVMEAARESARRGGVPVAPREAVS